MDTRSVKRRKKKKEEEEDGLSVIKVDRISDLPNSLLHQILLLLPLKSAAETSSLSKRWRSLFLSLPDLDFTSITNVRKPESSVSSDSIYKLLSLRHHRDSNNLRSLSFRSNISFTSLNSLIRLAVTHQVQDLDVEVCTIDYFNFPRWIVISQDLRSLRLKSYDPGFRLPPSSSILGGFQKLVTLSLSLVILYNQPCLNDFFIDPSFPVLENLALENCFGLKELKVSCRALQDFSLKNSIQLDGLEVSCIKLKRLSVVSCFRSYSDDSFMKLNAPNLTTFLWNLNTVTTNIYFLDKLVCLRKAFVGVFLHHQEVNAQTKSLYNLLLGLCNSYKLHLGNQIIEVLSSKKGLSVYNLLRFQNMRFLELETHFNSQNVQTLSSLFKSCPMLNTLILKIISNQTERRQWNKDLWDMSNSDIQYWESQACELESFVNHLEYVEIHGFLECENEMSLAIFLLRHGKALIKMTLRSSFLCRDSLRRQMIRSQLTGFSMASSNAKIYYQ